MFHVYNRRLFIVPRSYLCICSDKISISTYIYNRSTKSEYYSEKFSRIGNIVRYRRYIRDITQRIILWFL